MYIVSFCNVSVYFSNLISANLYFAMITAYDVTVELFNDDTLIRTNIGSNFALVASSDCLCLSKGRNMRSYYNRTPKQLIDAIDPDNPAKIVVFSDEYIKLNTDRAIVFSRVLPGAGFAKPVAVRVAELPQ